MSATYIGITKCKERARSVVFWPGMNRTIEEMISKCDTCQEYQASNPKEPSYMVTGQIPTRPWEIVVTYLFSWCGSDYLLIVDYYSRFIELAKLSNTKSQTVITHSKAIFARHRIPSIVQSDNGPQYSATKYSKFSKDWGFIHVTTSPYHSQSNSLTETSVQIVKRLLNKARKDSTDPYLGLLECRNTPIDNIGSLAQLSMSCQLRSSVMPTTSQHLKPTVIEPNVVVERLKQKQALRKRNYDKGARLLSSLQPNDKVRMQVQNQWVPATVVKKADTLHSYVVQTSDGKNYHRNRKHLGPLAVQAQQQTLHPLDTFDDAEIPLESTNVNMSESGASLDHEDSPTTEHQTQKGRAIRTPARYKDFVKL